MQIRHEKRHIQMSRDDRASLRNGAHAQFDAKEGEQLLFRDVFSRLLIGLTERVNTLSQLIEFEVARQRERM